MVAGCAGADRRMSSDFMMTSPTQFLMTASAAVNKPESSEKYEQERLDWIELYVAENGICPDGYDISFRNAVTNGRKLLGETHTVSYTGECR